MLQRKVSGHSSPSSSSPPPSIPSSGAGGGHRGDPGAATGAGLPSAAMGGTGSTNMAEQFSIAEMLARGMYGSDGIGAGRQHDVGVGGSGVVLDDSRNSSASPQPAAPSSDVNPGGGAGTEGTGARGGGIRLEGGSAAAGAADAMATATETAVLSSAGDAARAGTGAVDEDVGGGKGASQPGTAPSHGSARLKVGLGKMCRLSACWPLPLT